MLDFFPSERENGLASGQDIPCEARETFSDERKEKDGKEKKKVYLHTKIEKTSQKIETKFIYKQVAFLGMSQYNAVEEHLDDIRNMLKVLTQMPQFLLDSEGFQNHDGI